MAGITSMLQLREFYLSCLEDDCLLEFLVLVVVIVALSGKKRKRSHGTAHYSILDRMPTQVKHLARLTRVSNAECLSNLRMDRNTFGRLVILLREAGGLTDGKYVTVEEQVAIFLGILGHHKKNRVVGFDFWRSGETVSKYVHTVLMSILRINKLLLVKPEPVPVDSEDPRWKWFKGCLGALDGCYINVQVPTEDKPRYRTRKGQISTNTLAVCDRQLRFVYVLPGWEGSAADSRVLRSAINRGAGFKIPKGCYYLADNGYANTEGILTPYRGVRYHLKEWGPETGQPSNAHEMFNMRHSKARNVIERAFGVMKMRWGILRVHSYYPINIQIKLIAACFLLHNFIRSNMEVDPCEMQLDDEVHDEGHEYVEGDDSEFVEGVENTAQWTTFRETIANEMWNAGH